MGEAPITDDEEITYDGWSVENDEPEYYCLDDQWYEGQIFVRLELRPSKISTLLVQKLSTMLRDYSDWSVEIFTAAGLIWVWTDRIRVHGQVFEKCKKLEDLDSLCKEAAELLDTLKKEKSARLESRLKKIKPLAQKAYTALQKGKDAIALVTGFKTKTDGKPGISLWVMFKGPRDEFDLDEIPSEPDLVRLSLHGVTPDGQLIPFDNLDPSDDSREVLLLAELELVDDECEPLTDAERFKLLYSDRSYEFDLRTLRDG
jgi:hypothetical protein